MNNKIILVGGFHEVIELAESLHLEILGLIDNTKIDSYYGYPILGTDDDIEKLYNLHSTVPLIITPDQPLLRKKLFTKYEKKGFKFASLLSTDSKPSKTVAIGNGSIVQSDVNISSETMIGRFVKLNTRSNIMHDVTVGNFTTLAPNAVVLGHVKIGKTCYIGANATILPHVTICDQVVIGAGSVVTRDILQPGTYLGIPARFIHK